MAAGSSSQVVRKRQNPLFFQSLHHMIMRHDKISNKESCSINAESIDNNNRCIEDLRRPIDQKDEEPNRPTPLPARIRYRTGFGTVDI